VTPADFEPARYVPPEFRWLLFIYAVLVLVRVGLWLFASIIRAVRVIRSELRELVDNAELPEGAADLAPPKVLRFESPRRKRVG
jgi:hypothetical protein